MEEYDLIIVGGGPAGLSAAIGGASEGLKTLIIDSKPQLGGQIKDSTRVENYMGFPHGLKGTELIARSVEQVKHFKAAVCCPMKAVSIVHEGYPILVGMDDESTVATKALVLASGLSYNRLDKKGFSEYAGRGVTYGKPGDLPKKDHCRIIIIGGANSAGQAAHYLATTLHHEVHLFVRAEALELGMSQYLVERIRRNKLITVHTRTEVSEAIGNSVLRKVHYVQDGEKKEMAVDHVCIFIGAKPKTLWLKDILVRDKDKGFIYTDTSLGDRWTVEDRQPLVFETSMPGVFAVGDVRYGSTKRVAAAVGEGSVVIPRIHEYLHLLNEGRAF